MFFSFLFSDFSLKPLPDSPGGHSNSCHLSVPPPHPLVAFWHLWGSGWFSFAQNGSSPVKSWNRSSTTLPEHGSRSTLPATKCPACRRLARWRRLPPEGLPPRWRPSKIRAQLQNNPRQNMDSSFIHLRFAQAGKGGRFGKGHRSLHEQVYSRLIW